MAAIQFALGPAKVLHENVPEEVAGDFLRTKWPDANIAELCRRVLDEIANGEVDTPGEPGSPVNYKYFSDIVDDLGIGTPDVVSSSVVAMVSMASHLLYNEGGLAATSALMTAVAISGHVQNALDDIDAPEQIGGIIGPLAISAGYIIAASEGNPRDYIEAVDNLNIGVDIFGALDAAVSPELARHCIVPMMVFIDAIHPMIGADVPDEFASWKIDKESLVLLINDSMEEAEQAVRELEESPGIIEDLMSDFGDEDDDSGRIVDVADDDDVMESDGRNI